MESGASVNHQDCEGNTPVHVAIMERHSYKALEMIYKDFKVNSKNVKGVTCLMLAAECEEWEDWHPEISKDVVEALMQKGADVNLKDEEGNCVLHYLGNVLCWGVSIIAHLRQSFFFIFLSFDDFNICLCFVPGDICEFFLTLLL